MTRIVRSLPDVPVEVAQNGQLSLTAPGVLFLWSYPDWRFDATELAARRTDGPGVVVQGTLQLVQRGRYITFLPYPQAAS